MPPKGRVFAINVSNGGVPKLPKPSARITAQGVEGDRQRDRRFHGGPDRAVLVYSLEQIESLQREGHPIRPGSIGENLTLAGVDWSALAPGDLIDVGPVRLEITKAASPCENIAGSFVDGEFTRVSDKLRPGWSRFSTRVLKEGTVNVNDPVVVSRPPSEDL